MATQKLTARCGGVALLALLAALAGCNRAAPEAGSPAFPTPQQPGAQCLILQTLVSTARGVWDVGGAEKAAETIDEGIKLLAKPLQAEFQSLKGVPGVPGQPDDPGDLTVFSSCIQRFYPAVAPQLARCQPEVEYALVAAALRKRVPEETALGLMAQMRGRDRPNDDDERLIVHVYAHSLDTYAKHPAGSSSVSGQWFDQCAAAQ